MPIDRDNLNEPGHLERHRRELNNLNPAPVEPLPAAALAGSTTPSSAARGSGRASGACARAINPTRWPLEGIKAIAYQAELQARLTSFNLQRFWLAFIT